MKTVQKILFIVPLLLPAQPLLAVRPTQELLYTLAKPIIFTRTNVETFLTDVFNHPWYGSYCLPSSFMHIADLLAYQDQVKNPCGFSLSIFNLFHMRLKESSWVNPYALAQILGVINKECASLCQPSNAPRRVIIKKTLYEALLSRFNELKLNPELFMTKLADEIIVALEEDEQSASQELQQAITRFIESALDKIIWDPREQQTCWESCKLIAEQLNTLKEVKIIRNETTLNHCYWSLVYRFCYFIETTGEHLSPATYNLMKRDIAEHNCKFLELEEQESCLLSKSKRLQHAILEGEVKARSMEQGIWLQS